MDPDVIACVEDILDEMCVAEEKPDKGKKGSLAKFRFQKWKEQLYKKIISLKYFSIPGTIL